LDRGVHVYAYFNNDYEAAAVHDAAALRELLGSKPYLGANPVPA
jgi:uncharacterized protein YecE (DUF72 family)